MAGQNPLSNLAAISLRQIRQLARSLGIARDTSDAQNDLKEVSNDQISAFSDSSVNDVNAAQTAVDNVERVSAQETTEFSKPIAFAESTSIESTVEIGRAHV